MRDEPKSEYAQSVPWVLESRVCDVCSGTYQPVQPHQKYCSAKCKNKAKHEARRKNAGTLSQRPCASCGTLFSPKTLDHVYCTQRCQRNTQARTRVWAKSGAKAREAGQERNRLIANERKLIGCRNCGWKPTTEAELSAMDFHHRDPLTKKYNISMQVKHGFSVKKFLEELEKCDVLCARCHRIVEFILRQQSQSA